MDGRTSDKHGVWSPRHWLCSQVWGNWHIDIELRGQLFQVPTCNSGGEMLDFLKFICQHAPWITESLLLTMVCTFSCTSCYPAKHASNSVCTCCTRFSRRQRHLLQRPFEAWRNRPGASADVVGPLDRFPGASGAPKTWFTWAKKEVEFFSESSRGVELEELFWTVSLFFLRKDLQWLAIN